MKYLPVPELVAWRPEDNINHLYMSLIPGVTSNSCWSTLTTEERTTIADQLGDILTTFRSARQSHGTEYIGKNAGIVPYTSRWLNNHQAHSIMVPFKQAASAVTVKSSLSHSLLFVLSTISLLLGTNISSKHI